MRETGDDAVRPLTRGLAAIIVPVLVAAFIMLYLLPDRTGELFAWPIGPHMTAMMLGATYLGGAYFFSWAVITKHWHHVQLGFLPVAVLCAILGLATALHWESFNHGHISFILWMILYFGLPFVLPYAWYRNQRTTGHVAGPLLPRVVRGVFMTLGVVFVVVGVLLLVVPDLVIPTWPWTLSPLTARVMSAMFTLTGLIAAGIALDGRWSATHRILQAQGVAVTLILLGVILARDDWDWSRAASWFFLAGLVLVLVLVVTVLALGRKRAAPARLSA